MGRDFIFRHLLEWCWSLDIFTWNNRVDWGRVCGVLPHALPDRSCWKTIPRDDNSRIQPLGYWLHEEGKEDEHHRSGPHHSQLCSPQTCFSGRMMRQASVTIRLSIFEDASEMLWVCWPRLTMWRRLATGISGFEITVLNATPSWIVCTSRCVSHIEMKKEVSLLELKLEEKRRKLQALIAQVRIHFNI